MKLINVVIAGVFALSSTAALADHRDKPGWHHGRHKHNVSCSHKYKHKHKHHQRAVAHRDQQHAFRGHQGRHHDTNYARVVAVEPVYRFIDYPVRDNSCLRHDKHRSGYNSHTATVLGAVIGGALGHRIGDSHGDPDAAAVAGGLLGASVGRDIDQRARYRSGLRVEGPCRVSSRHTQTRRELVEYQVTYRYNGRLHYIRMDYDPGEWVKLDVSYTPA